MIGGIHADDICCKWRGNDVCSGPHILKNYDRSYLSHTNVCHWFMIDNKQTITLNSL